MSEPILCYVDGPWAYFTTQKLEDQWGDDFDDAPYEHNAGPPYEYNPNHNNGKKPWKIIKVAYDGNFEEAKYYNHNHIINSPYSVQQINTGTIPWLTCYTCKKPLHIYAGTKLEDFCNLIRKGGGSVYMEAKQ